MTTTPTSTISTEPTGGAGAYLSRIWLNPLRTGAQKLLRSPEAVHAAVLGGLAEQPVTQRILWRLETSNPHRAELLVLTRSTPSWEHVVEQAGWPGADTAQAAVALYDPLLSRLTVGQEYTFRLRANTVGSTRNPAAPSLAQKEHLAATDRPRGVRVPHRTAAHQLDWLTTRIENWGLTLVPGSAGAPQVELRDRQRLTFTKSRADGSGGGTHGRSRPQVVLQTATFEGRVQITDTDAVRTTLLDGVGRAKAYGCGLLTLAPARGRT